MGDQTSDTVESAVRPRGFSASVSSRRIYAERHDGSWSWNVIVPRVVANQVSALRTYGWKIIGVRQPYDNEPSRPGDVVIEIRRV